ncbi:MAG: hypothetical protein HC880_16565, partial [Bacteroidia bacterium]|nr:hypothetical protein [Bacteroidia bacterium]
KSFDPGTGFEGEFESLVYALALQSDGKIVVGAILMRLMALRARPIARLNADGSLDADFNPGDGFTFGVVYSLALQPDAKVVTGGFFQFYDGISRSHIARLNPDGSLDTDFNPGTGFDNEVSTLALLPDGKILAGGHFTTYQGNSRNHLARLLSDGSLDTDFDPNTGFDDRVTSLAVQADGKLLIGGAFANYQGIFRRGIARLLTNANLDEEFNPNNGFNGSVNSLALQPDGHILAGGAFTALDTTGRNRIARVIGGGAAIADLEIIHLRWYNADTDKMISYLENGDIINLAEVTGRLDILATAGANRPGSVVFILNGKKVNTELFRPYYLGANVGTDAHGYDFAPGDYHLEVIPYTEQFGRGLAGKAMVLDFTIIIRQILPHPPVAF